MSTALTKFYESDNQLPLMHQLAKISGYETEVPTIEKFMDDPYYLGKSLMKANGKSSVYPLWRNAACKLYPTPYHTTKTEVYLTGG